MFTFSSADREQSCASVWRGDAQGGWNSRNDCLDLVGLLMQTQVKAAGGSHNDHSVAPEVGWSSQGFCFLSRRVNTSHFQTCVFKFMGENTVSPIPH